MYTPSTFKNEDLAEIHQFCDQYGFATVISNEGELGVSHLPLILDRAKGPRGTLLGHLAKANAHWKTWSHRTSVTCIFQGPHHYISPKWYRDAFNVPTWNYAVVHASGTPRLIEDHDGIESILDRTVKHFESRQGTGWKYELPADFRAGLTRAIVGFEIEITEIEAKFKLSQNREYHDREGAIQGLSALRTFQGDEMASLMKSHWPEKFSSHK